MELQVHDRQGNVTGTIQFDESCLGKFINYTLMHDAIVMYEANRRQGNAKTKGRRELVGSSKKPYRQKGTGRARMGHFRRVGSRGGATCHGPLPRDYTKAMTKKARKAAVRSALLGKFRDNEVVVVSDLDLAAPKTKEMAQAIKNLKVDTGCLVVVEKPSEVVWKSVRNIPATDLAPLADLNAYGVLLRKNILITKAALEAMQQEMK